MNLKFWEKLHITDELSAVERITIFLAEFFGTAFLMFIGCLGCAHIGIGPVVIPRPLPQSGLSFGLGVLIAIQCFAHISGAHINPVVTFGAFMNGYIALIEMPIYIVAQILGSLSGFGLVRLLLLDEYIYSSVPLIKTAGVCAVGLHPDLTPSQGLFIEVILSFSLVSIALSVWDSRNAENLDTIPIKFGLGVACLVMTGGTFTASHMNPARTIGPAIINNFWEYHWIFWLGPFMGSLISSLCYSIIFSK